jgi:hypothetical protein
MNRRLQTFVGRLAVWASLAISVSGCAAAIVGLGVVCCATPAVAALAAHSSASPADTADTTATIEVPEVECAACNIEVRKAIKRGGVWNKWHSASSGRLC